MVRVAHRRILHWHVFPDASMKEKIPGSGPIDFEKKRLEMRNAKVRRTTEVTPEGNFLYPQNTYELTTREAVDIAHQIVEQFRSVESREADYLRREEERNAFFNIPPSKWELVEAKERFESSLRSQESTAHSMTTDALLSVIDFHKKNPRNYYATLLFATAEELLRRFPQPEIPSRDGLDF